MKCSRQVIAILFAVVAAGAWGTDTSGTIRFAKISTFEPMRAPHVTINDNSAGAGSWIKIDGVAVATGSVVATTPTLQQITNQGTTTTTELEAARFYGSGQPLSNVNATLLDALDSTEFARLSLANTFTGTTNTLRSIELQGDFRMTTGGMEIGNATALSLIVQMAPQISGYSASYEQVLTHGNDGTIAWVTGQSYNNITISGLTTVGGVVTGVSEP